MRFYEGDYAYEIERVRDTATQLYTGWRYNVYRIRPDQKLLRSANVTTQQEAENDARRVLDAVVRADHDFEGATDSRAA
ncbi:MAG TPA: hypothetical protein VMU05_02805 [Dongiaceae bacterium]|nr:hypothetical protein [Dongiaceae bacterium]